MRRYQESLNHQKHSQSRRCCYEAPTSSRNTKKNGLLYGNDCVWKYSIRPYILRADIFLAQNGDQITSSKPYHWKSMMSEEINRNHNVSNIRLRAKAAQMPVKDKRHKRFHSLDQNQASEQEFFGCSKTLRDENTLPASRDKSTKKEGGVQNDMKMNSEMIATPIIYNQETLMNYATDSKEKSIFLQNVLIECSEFNKTKLRAFLFFNFNELIQSKFGNFFIQSMVEYDNESLKKTTEICMDKFDKFSKNDHSSRVLLKLMRINEVFRIFAMRKFGKKFENYLKSTPSGFLISFGVSQVNTPKETYFIFEYICKNPNKWSRSKVFKKILLAFISFCPEETLNRLVSLLALKSDVFKYLKEKFMCLILVRLIERGHPETLKLTLKSIRERPLDFLDGDYIGYFVAEINKWPELDRFSEAVQALLLQMTTNTELFLLISKRTSLLQVYCGSISLYVYMKQTNRRNNIHQAENKRQVDRSSKP